MAKQRSAILVFKPGTPKDQIELALRMISCLLDETCNVPGKNIPHVEDFDPSHGTPSFYIP